MTQEQQFETLAYFIQELGLIFKGFDATHLYCFMRGDNKYGSHSRDEMMIKWDQQFIDDMSLFFTKQGNIRKCNYEAMRAAVSVHPNGFKQSVETKHKLYKSITKYMKKHLFPETKDIFEKVDLK